jgi:hypothetical protein
MDAGKLLRVVHDSQNDEKTLSVAAKIDAIRNDVAQNNAAGVEAARQKFEELRSTITAQSISYTFSTTETRLLEEIGAEAYVGKGLIEHLQSILSSRGFEMTAMVDDYRAKRTEVINKMGRLVVALQEVGIQEYRPAEDEVSIVLPEEDGDLQKLQKHLGKFKRVLTVIAEITNADYQHVSISRVSSGSPLEFFSLQSVDTAALLSDLFRNVAWAWQKVKKLQQKAEAVEGEDLLDDNSKRVYRDALAVQASRELDRIESELPDQLLQRANRQPDPARVHEVKQELKAAVHFVFGWLNGGIELDITLSRKQTTSETGEEQRDPEKANIMREANAALQEVYKLPKKDRVLPLPAAYLNEPDELPGTEAVTDESEEE